MSIQATAFSDAIVRQPEESNQRSMKPCPLQHRLAKARVTTAVLIVAVSRCWCAPKRIRLSLDALVSRDFTYAAYIGCEISTKRARVQNVSQSCH